MADMASTKSSPDAGFNIQVSGRHMELGDTFRSRAEENLEAAIDKYFDRSGSKGGSGEIRVGRDGHAIHVEINLLLGTGQHLVANGEAGEAHAAFDTALSKLEKQIRRYHRELTSHKPHNGGARSPADRAPLSDATAAISAEDDDTDVTAEWGADGSAGSGQPRGAIIAETPGPLKPMTVAMAAMQLEANNAGALVFRNVGSGSVSVVYQRADGNIGWIDAERDETGAARPAENPDKRRAGTAT